MFCIFDVTCWCFLRRSRINIEYKLELSGCPFKVNSNNKTNNIKESRVYNAPESIYLALLLHKY